MFPMPSGVRPKKKRRSRAAFERTMLHEKPFFQMLIFLSVCFCSGGYDLSVKFELWQKNIQGLYCRLLTSSILGALPLQSIRRWTII